MNNDSQLTPFRIDISQAAVDDLKDRLECTRWAATVPGRDDRTDFSRGIPQPYLRELAELWREGFDWRAQETALNVFPQLLTTVDEQTFHVVHVASSNPDATPLLLCHGWPGSFVEYRRLMPLLADDFHVVVPSPPGFGFSTPLSSTGWEIGRTAEAYAEIMTRLGYDRFVAHGTDTGSGIVAQLATTHPERVLGMHLACEQRLLGLVGVIFPAPDDLSAQEETELATMGAEAASDRGYLEMQNHKPDTIGAALTDSPVGQLAWIAEKFKTRGDRHATPSDSVDRDDLLTNVSLYWFTRSGESSAQFYYEATHSGMPPAMGAAVPAGWAVFDANPLVRRAMDPQRSIGHWTEFAEGGHFPALEEPDLLAQDIRDFVHSIR
ncbi:epoxide hydrolase family protein [Agromyces sp. NPDC056379]|uniref:epoxide hydrolase family protein n=1 Tax=unclassified Agromyces TaxID=2639701 RepID=UPI0035E36F68